MSNIYPYRNCSTRCPAGIRAVSWATSQRSLGALAGSIWPRLARSGRPWCAWLVLAGSIWLRLARSGCPGRPARVAWAPSNVLAGSIWLPTLALGAQQRLAGSICLPTKAPTLSFSTVCLDAACLVRSGTSPHASNLVIIYYVGFLSRENRQNRRYVHTPIGVYVGSLCSLHF